MGSKTIVVNASALDRSGALSILQQFVENIPVDEKHWLIFVSPNILVCSENPNVRIEPVMGVKQMYKRLWWDAIGLRKWLKKNNINPIASVSLQNTGFNVGENVPSYIYYHQSIPFIQSNWNPFKKQERSLWFYKHIYPFFVKLFLKKETKVFVQLDYIKKGFAKRYNHSLDNIIVSHPSTEIPPKKIESKSSSDSIKIIYPAMNYFYKNHRVIEEAVKYIDRDIDIFFTIDKSSTNITNGRIHCIGFQPYERICEMYYVCDALLFPSYIETYGLPLLEAALTGMPIIAADLPYAREVLEGYEGVTFVKYDKPMEWAEAINNLKKNKRYKPIDILDRPGWKELFENI